ncbi:MAG: class I SAM-dependent methyltransferase [Clostridiales Family XIII bacterium]|jgi:SAM-dependent methyltransferase|nr:class I SAM-dependent methyltransferase [Clostridiales Family XIII bacterium]
MHDTEKIGGVTLHYTFYDTLDDYNDGDEVEEFILDVLKSDKDVFEVLSGDDRWPVLYHLSPRRENIVEPMNIAKSDEVLEIGAGMGSVTAPLSRLARHVDCIELSKRRSLANAHRNRERDNIDIFVGNFEKIRLEKQYEAVVLIGVLEYARYYVPGDDPFRVFLRKAYDFLKPGGKIYVAIENRLGMKYFSGAPEDHLGIPYCGIEGYVRTDGKARTFSRSELDRLIADAGFVSSFFYYPFPDYKLPTIIYSDAYPPLPGDVLPAGPVYDLPRLSVFKERDAMLSLFGTEEYKYFANSFLVEAVKI